MGREQDHGTGPDSSGVGLLRSAVRRDIVDQLRQLMGAARTEGLSAREIGERVGLHVTTARFHLTQLVDAGILTDHTARTPGAGRPTKRYAIAPSAVGVAGDDAGHRVLAELLVEAMASPEGLAGRDPEDIGAAWARQHALESTGRTDDGRTPAATPGEWLGKIGALVDVLRAWHYSLDLRMENSGRSARIDLLGCPFRALALEHREIVCGIHRGLMRGTLDVVGEQAAELTLTPFVEPEQCVALVTTSADFTPTGGTT